jgi:hypothetical protein
MRDGGRHYPAPASAGNYDDYDEDLYLNIFEESSMGPAFRFNQTDPTYSNAQCGIGYGSCSVQSKTYGQYVLDPTKTYYLILQNPTSVSQGATAYVSIRDGGELLPIPCDEVPTAYVVR